MTARNLIRIFLVAFAISAKVRSEEPYVLWAKNTGTGGYLQSAVDTSGNIVTFTASTSGSLTVTKLDAAANATTDAIALSVYPVAVASGSEAEVYVAGYVAAENHTTWVVGRLNNQSSQLQELITIRSADEVYNLHVTPALSRDLGGNLYLGFGYVQSDVIINGVRLSCREGLLFCKFSSGGALVWAKNVECTFLGMYPGGIVYRIVTDRFGNVLISGYIREAVADFGGQVVEPDSTGFSYNGDWFLAKYTPDGELSWVKLGYMARRTLAIDGEGFIYGWYDWSKAGASGLAKLNRQGDVIWNRELGSYPETLRLSADGGILFCGQYEGTTKLGPFTLRSRSSIWSDLFLAKADQNGSMLWVTSGGGSFIDVASDIIEIAGKLFVGGSMSTRGSLGGITVGPAAIDSYTPFIALLSETPPLKIQATLGTATISWPLRATNYVLEASSSIGNGAGWTTLPEPPTATSTSWALVLTNNANVQMFRLRRK